MVLRQGVGAGARVLEERRALELEPQGLPVDGGHRARGEAGAQAQGAREARAVECAPAHGEPRLEPAVGTVLDPRNAEVRLTVQMTFSAFAVKSENTVQNQLQRVVPLRFQSGSTPVCKVGELPKFRISNWQTTQSGVAINGEVQCAPQMPVDDAVVASLPSKLQGLKTDQAQQVLDALKTSGVISDYQLPARAEMPPLAQLITIRVGGSMP